MSKARLYDLAAASPLIVLYAFAIAGFALQIRAEFTHSELFADLILSAGVKVASALFVGLQIILFVIRKLPIAKSEGWLPRIVAILAANSALPLLLLPAAKPSAIVTEWMSLLSIGGTIASIWIAAHLGRAFSITPQARVLVMDGPYRVIRHPLYLAEQITVFGISWQFRQPWALVIFAVGFAAQLLRMHYEENVLSATFPAYRTYASNTFRWIPHIY